MIFLFLTSPITLFFISSANVPAWPSNPLVLDYCSRLLIHFLVFTPLPCLIHCPPIYSQHGVSECKSNRVTARLNILQWPPIHVRGGKKSKRLIELPDSTYTSLTPHYHCSLISRHYRLFSSLQSHRVYSSSNVPRSFCLQGLAHALQVSWNPPLLSPTNCFSLPFGYQLQTHFLRKAFLTSHTWLCHPIICT